QQAAMLLAHNNARRVLPLLIIYIPVGRWQPVPTPNIDAVENLVQLYCPPEIQPYLNALESAGRLVVIFDGLDEMSRERYTEHTTALSKYAESRKGRVRTLFSCRIADFSPDFQHRRLVLLPFDVSHVRTYLVRQFGRSKIKVDSALLTPSTLAKKI